MIGGSRGIGPLLASAIPLPDDASIFGAMTEGAYYIFREPYITLSGSDILTAVNVANPGTRDITFSASPVYVSSGGPNDKPYANFNGTSDTGTATGFSFVEGSATNEPFVIAIGRFHTNGAPGQAVGLEGSGGEFAVGMQQRTTVWRWNGAFVNVPHAVSGGAPDTNWHAFALLTYSSTGFRGDLDGVLDSDVGGTGGTTGTLDVLRVGAAAGGTGEFGQCDICEIVIVEGRTQAEYDNYLDLRTSLEYGVP